MSGQRCSVRVYSRVACCLCDELMEHLQYMQETWAFDLEKIDISGDEWLNRIHGERVPVVEINGREIGWGRIPAGILEQHIRQMAPHR